MPIHGRPAPWLPELKMPLFSRGPSARRSGLPADIIGRMEFYGRYEFAPHEAPPEAAERVNRLIYQALYPVASENPDTFVSELAAAVLPVGGWSVYGGQRCVRDLIAGGAPDHPGYLAMVEAAMAFLRDSGYGLGHLAPVESEIWRRLHPAEHW